MKNIEERKEIRQEYINNWLKYKDENPDMPLRDNYSGVGAKKKYREEKNKWIATKVDMTDYCKRRMEHFKNDPEKVAGYQNIINTWKRLREKELLQASIPFGII